MKQSTLALATLAALLMVVGGSAFIERPHVTKPTTAINSITDRWWEQPFKVDVTNYIWYLDSDMTEPTGTCSETEVEITRLRQLFTMYTFSQFWDPYLHVYEWGYYPYYSVKHIYSDIDLTIAQQQAIIKAHNAKKGNQ